MVVLCKWVVMGERGGGERGGEVLIGGCGGGGYQGFFPPPPPPPPPGILPGVPEWRLKGVEVGVEKGESRYGVEC